MTNYTKEFFSDCGKRGGKIGGKASGPRKRRDKEHYNRIAQMGVEARRRKREGKEND